MVGEEIKQIGNLTGDLTTVVIDVKEELSKEKERMDESSEPGDTWGLQLDSWLKVKQ
jgi:hypothetical protein